MELKKCEKCGYKKYWDGSDINCPFQTEDVFGENWNCGVIGRIRDLCDKAMDGADYRLHYKYCDDQKYVVINTDWIREKSQDELAETLGLCLWVSWYKSRGGTDAMWILDNHDAPIKPTFEQLQLISDLYEKYPLPE